MNAKPLPSISLLQELLDYNPDTGMFYWRRRVDGPRWWNCRYAGMLAGSPFIHGKYTCIRIAKECFLAHRVAFKMMTGCDPVGEVDHKDLDGRNNKWSNLRDSTRSQNMSNTGTRSHNSHGFKGVTFHNETGKYRARVRCDGVVYECGLHHTPEAAHDAYAERAKELHGEFSREA